MNATQTSSTDHQENNTPLFSTLAQRDPELAGILQDLEELKKESESDYQKLVGFLKSNI